MADARHTSSRNRRYGEKPMGRKFLVFVGDCSQVGQFLASKPITPLWVMVGFLDSLLRTYGQVVFCNNPVTGLLVLTALIVANSRAAFVGLVASTIAIFIAWLVDQPSDGVRAGVFSYNALLVGQLTPVLLPEISIIEWIFIVIGVVLSVYFTSAFGALFANISKHPMPALTVPFVAAQLLVYLCATSPAVQQLRHLLADNATLPLLAGGNGSIQIGFDENSTSGNDMHFSTTAPPFTGMSVLGNLSSENVTLNPHVNSTADGVNWGEVFTGVLRSLAQVYGQSDLVASLLMYLGVLICSPTTALMGLLGSTISTLVGTLLNAGGAEGVYGGAWGYNGLLSAGCVGGFALVLTPQAAALALAAALLAGALHSALLPAFQRVDVPILTLPFNLASLLLLCVTAKGAGSLVRPAALTYPEKHRRDWMSDRASCRTLTTTQNVRSGSESIPEEGEKKEQFRKLEAV